MPISCSVEEAARGIDGKKGNFSAMEGWKHLDLLRQIPIILTGNDNAGYDAPIQCA